jgi:16S rRNA processing protein RimM
MPSTPNELLPVGRIAGVFGIHGEVKCDPTSAGRTLFLTGSSFEARLRDGTHADVVVSSVREHKARLLLTLDGVHSATEAERFSDAVFYAERGRIHLETGEYLDADLQGCRIVDADGRDLGAVDRVEHYPASDMLVVHGKMIPMIREFIKLVDISGKRIVVDVPPGLLDDD